MEKESFWYTFLHISLILVIIALVLASGYAVAQIVSFIVDVIFYKI